MTVALRLFLIGLLALLSLSSCSAKIHKPTDKSWNHSSTASHSQAAVHLVKHAMGKTLVPLHPKRVVALHWYATEVAGIFGIKLLGAPVPILHPELRRDDFVDLGWFPPNMEKVVALKPDLLLGSAGWFKDTYNLWSQIAPTVLDSMKYNGQWKEPFMQIVEALGQTESAKQVVAQYNARVAEFKHLMGERLKTLKVSVVQIMPGSINLLKKSAFSGTILSDLGIARPPFQDMDAKTSLQLGENPVNYPISEELLPLIDADILFVIPFSFNKKNSYQKMIEQLMAQPLWRKLKVVQQGKVYVMGEYWLAGSYISANKVLDDLFRYLVKEQ
ncbi:MAG: iron-siderophore ABC transporter substrate-binding protein [Nostoc sp.]|uniref:iron-siderophore ABC transporter substrate-binding protein n=1 Tax=Nostoc sp. TaxID=1180 RepID=UPI002FF473A7